MKKLMLFSLLFLFITGCEKKESKVEIINLSNENYLTTDQADNPSDLLASNFESEVYSKLDNKLNEDKLIVSDNAKCDFQMFINESGKPDKIIIISATDEKIAKIIADILSKEKYNIAKKDNQPAKYYFKWSYSAYRDFAEKMPQIIGGIEAITKNLHYPEIAKKAGIEGRVMVSLKVNEKGNVVEAKVLKGIGSGCDEAAVDVLKKLKFTPAMNNNIPVKVRIVIPIVFKLAKGSK